MCLVSIIIPTYKHQDFVLATLDSVFAQTFTDYEVIVINDGSPDDTVEVLRPLVKAGRIRYIEQKNQGQSAARNRGLSEAKGEYIALLDDDDLWPPEKLEWQVKALREASEAVMVYGGVSSVGSDFDLAEEGQVLKGMYPDKESSQSCAYTEFMVSNPTRSPGQTLIRAATLKQINGFDESIWGADDYDLYIRLSKKGDFIYVNHLALYYREHAENASKDFRRHYRNVCAVHRKHLGRYPFASDNKLWLLTYHQWRQAYVRAMLDEINLCVEKGNKAKGRKIWRWALLIPPNRSQMRRMASLFWSLR